MTLSESFNEHCKPRKVNDCVLSVYSDNVYHRFDFIMRTVRVLEENYNGSERISTITLPFSQLDREVLEMARNQLIDLGGKPPELPPLQQPDPPKGNKLNL